MQGNPPPKIIAPGASPSEVAAIAAALEQFLRDTAPPVTEQRAAPTVSPWVLAALLEGVSRQPDQRPER